MTLQRARQSPRAATERAPRCPTADGAALLVGEDAERDEVRPFRRDGRAPREFYRRMSGFRTETARAATSWPGRPIRRLNPTPSSPTTGTSASPVGLPDPLPPPPSPPPAPLSSPPPPPPSLPPPPLPPLLLLPLPPPFLPLPSPPHPFSLSPPLSPPSSLPSPLFPPPLARQPPPPPLSSLLSLFLSRQALGTRPRLRACFARRRRPRLRGPA